MKSYVITDNISTLVGMQLAGVEGELVFVLNAKTRRGGDRQVDVCADG